jgi:hypothetical protein
MKPNRPIPLNYERVTRRRRVSRFVAWLLLTTLGVLVPLFFVGSITLGIAGGMIGGILALSLPDSLLRQMLYGWDITEGSGEGTNDRSDP